jgi:signal transduction histidine kinase
MSSRGTVLVVDDDPMNRALVCACLRNEHRLVEADNGPEALELAAREPVDLVLLDVMMPGMSGFDVCRELKRRSDGQALLPVLLLTALADQVDRNVGLAAGADDYLTKPIDRHELRMRVSAFLRLRNQDQLLRRQYEHLHHLAALKDDLVSLMVHDLRNPLSSVLALLGVLQHDLADPQLKGDALTARSAAAKMQEIVDDILQIRLLEEEQVTLDLGRLRAPEIVGEAIASIAPVARARGVELELHADGDVAVTADRKLLRRAVENLLANAVRHSPPREKVEVAVSAEEGGVEIEVADRGPGVPEPLRAVLFEKFGSVEAAQKQARRGHGLGLYLVKLVATAHGGRTSVRSREGGGSVFGMWLPRPAEAP